MILQALYEYYKRMPMAPEGWIYRGIDYVIVLNSKGECEEIDCLQWQDGKKTKSRQLLVPYIGKQALKHSNSGTDANLLWDRADFVLGLGNNGVIKQKSFLQVVEKWVEDSEDPGILATLNFLRKGINTKDYFNSVLKYPVYGAELETGVPIISFRYFLDSEKLVFDRTAVHVAYDNKQGDTSENDIPGVCLVTGERADAIEESHTVIKNVLGAQPAGGSIVSFNREAFCSYLKRKSFNSPVSKKVAAAYVKALNNLLAEGSRQRVQIGDASTVFWAAAPTEYESAIPDAFGEAPKDDPGRLTTAVKNLYEAIHNGKLGAVEGQIRYYILGLAPNDARISVRFWAQATLREIAERVLSHFADLKIVHRTGYPEYPSIKMILLACTVRNNEKSIPPDLGGNIVRAIMGGTAYPATLLNATVSRFRHEDKDDGSMERTYLRAAIIKACINREIRKKKQGMFSQEREVTEMLDLENKNPAYLLGRLFAVFEKIQLEASSSRKLNSTIRDRYYGAASATPAIVFPTLLRLKTHHLGKLVPGRKVQMERLIGEIIDGFEAKNLPNHLRLPEQGMFAIGYYHQWQKLFTK